MAPAFPVNEAQLVALFVESVAYGIYLVTFGMCVRLLFWDSRGERKRHLNWPLVLTTFLIFVFATFDVAFGLRHALVAFVFYSGAGGSAEAYETISDWVNVMKTVDNQVMLMIVDAFLIYRCFVVFYRKWLVISFPLLMWLANLANSIIIIYITATLKTHATLNVNNLMPFITSFLVLNLATNMLVTGLIAWRIHAISKESSRLDRVGSSGTSRRVTLAEVNRIVIESGLLNLLVVFVGFVTFLTNSNAVYAVSDLSIEVVGITFNLITIRVNNGVSFGETTKANSSIPLRLVNTGAGTKNSALPVHQSRTAVGITVSHTVENDHGESITQKDIESVHTGKSEMY